MIRMLKIYTGIRKRKRITVREIILELLVESAMPNKKLKRTVKERIPQRLPEISGKKQSVSDYLYYQVLSELIDEEKIDKRINLSTDARETVYYAKHS